MAVSKHPLIRSEAGARALALLASLPGQELHTNELIRRTRSNARAVQKALVQLESSGLLESRRVGNLRLWRMDQSSPLYAAVREVFTRTRGIPAVLARVLAGDPAVELAFLFGSFVTAQDDPTSDIDLFLFARARLKWQRLSESIAEVGRQLGRELRPVIWSATDLRHPTAAQEAFLSNVIAAPKIWLVGREDDLERVRGSLAAAVGDRRPPGTSRRGGKSRPPRPRQAARLTRTKSAGRKRS
jgi:predicted nucleotidyltransferase